MNRSLFVDLYDVLQISPSADDDTIQQMFRHLAKKWHPDNLQGDNERFALVVEAHKTLSNPEKRAAYDLRYQRFWESRWGLAADASDGRIVSNDSEVRESLLSLYYVQRRSNMNDPGLGEMEVARLIRIPIHLVEFHIWYLKEKNWIQRLENGKFALTAQGVDEVEKTRLRLNADRLITSTAQASEDDAEDADLEPKGSLTAGIEDSESS